MQYIHKCLNKISVSTIFSLIVLTNISPCRASTITYTYDITGKLQNIRCSDGQVAEFSYDFSGNLVSYNSKGGGYPTSAFLLLLNDLRQTNQPGSILNK